MKPNPVSPIAQPARPVQLRPVRLPFEPEDTLSVFQKYMLRVIYGFAGKTILHRGRLVEVLETRESARRVLPLVEPDLSESPAPSYEPNTSVRHARPRHEIVANRVGLEFWIPNRADDRKKFNVERRNKSRGQQTIGVVWGEARPKGAIRRRLRSRFPSPEFLRRIVREEAYPPEAAIAAVARTHTPWVTPRPDRRKSSAVNMDDQNEGRGNEGMSFAQPGHPYYPESPSRRTSRGGGFTREQVNEGLEKLRTGVTVKRALFEIVYKRRSTLQVADELNLPAENLHVYASRLRGRIRQSLRSRPSDLRQAA